MLTTKFYLPFAFTMRQDQPRIRAIYSAHRIWSKRYPQWSEAFFDAYFLRTRVIPLLVDGQVEPATVDPMTLVQEWVDQFPGTENKRHRLIAELTPAVADFLQFVIVEERYFVSEAVRRKAHRHKPWGYLSVSRMVELIRCTIERVLGHHAPTTPPCR